MADAAGEPVRLANLFYKADSVQALKDLYEPSHPTNWVAIDICQANKRKKLRAALGGSGSDGLAGLIQNINENPNRMLYVGIQINSTDPGGSERSKYVFTKYIGETLPLKVKASGATVDGDAMSQFQNKHITINGVGATDYKEHYTLKNIGNLLLKVGGAHKPEKYLCGEEEIEAKVCMSVADIDS